MWANISLKEGYLGEKESLFWAEKQKLPKRVWVKAASIGLSQAAACGIAGWAGDEGCLVELGKAVNIGFWVGQAGRSKGAGKSWAKLGYKRTGERPEDFAELCQSGLQERRKWQLRDMEMRWGRETDLLGWMWGRGRGRKEKWMRCTKWEA